MGLPRWAHQSFTKGFAGSDFAQQPDGTLRCPAGHPLSVHERRPERNGSVRLVYGARMMHCRPCPLRDQCQESPTTIKPRQVSAIVWPLAANPSVSTIPPPLSPPPALTTFPVLWGDWPRCSLRRHWLRLLRTQTVDLTLGSSPSQEMKEPPKEDVQTRAQRAHYRFRWDERLPRNARLASTIPLTITIYGLPASFAQY